MENTLQPSWRFVIDHPAHFIATGAGVGLIPVAPGTFGTLLAFPIEWLVAPSFAGFAFAIAVVVMFVVGVWACNVTGRHLGVADHPSMVWDEVVAFALVLWFVPQTYAWQSVAFVLFRLFDVVKPPPIGYYDRTLKNGFGVMLDDMLAAFYALILLALAKTAIT